MRTLPSILLFGALLLACSACSEPKDHEATVVLNVAGESHDYATKAAHVEVRSDPGTYSVYLMPNTSGRAATSTPQPYVSLRTYSGNPVRRLSLHYQPPGADEPRRYECFVPGKLPDGRSTRAWKTADGEARDRTQTGDADCQAAIARAGETLRFTFEATLRPAVGRGKKKGKKGKKGKKPDEAAEKAGGTVKIAGGATIRI